MKKLKIFPLIIAFLLLCSFGYSQDTNQKEKIAILGFGGNVQTWIKETLTNQLENEIVNLGRFDIVNRRSIQAAIEELKINLTGLVNDEQTIKAGEFLTAHKLIIGQVNYCNVNWNMKQVTRMVNGKSRTFKVRMYKAEISISAKIIEVENNVLSDGINVLGIGENENKNNAIINAVNSAVANIILKMREIYQLEARVIKKDLREIYINMGKDYGIKKGLVFKVIRKETTLIDDLSAESIDLENEIGLVYIDKVYPKYSSAKIIHGNYSINKGDLVKESLTDRLHRFAILGSYSVIPLKSKITKSLGGKKIRESINTGISIFLDSYHTSNAYELQLSFLKAGKLRGILGDLNYRRKYNILPEYLDFYAGGSIGFVSLEQKIIDPDSAWAVLNKVGSDNDVRDNCLTLSATVSVRATFIKLLHPYAEAGWHYCNTLDEWMAEYKTGKTVDGKPEKKDTRIPDEFLEYPSIKMNGFSYRIGLMLSF
jgi:hypothetical protein